MKLWTCPLIALVTFDVVLLPSVMVCVTGRSMIAFAACRLCCGVCS